MKRRNKMKELLMAEIKTEIIQTMTEQIMFKNTGLDQNAQG